MAHRTHRRIAKRGEYKQEWCVVSTETWHIEPGRYPTEAQAEAERMSYRTHRLLHVARMTKSRLFFREGVEYCRGGRLFTTKVFRRIGHTMISFSV